MKGFVITSKGLEETAAKELKELIGAVCNTEECCVVFEFKDFKDLCLLCYKSQSIDRALFLLGNFELRDFKNDFEKCVNGLDFKNWLEDYSSFKIECIRIGSHDFRSTDVEAKLASVLLKKSKKIKFDIKNPGIIFFAYVIGAICYIGVDFAGFELNKRQYKVFLHPSSIRGTIGYSLLRESGFKKNEVMLDPFSRDGIIPIEAGLFAAGFPVGYFNKNKFAFLKLKLGIDFDKFFSLVDKKIKKSKTGIHSFDHIFKYVDFSKKNAKIAGIDKQINFSRVELEWLDIKFKEQSVDRIISNPVTSKNADLEKIYKEFFYQCAYILKKSGTIAIVTRIPDFVKKHAQNHGFEVEREKNVWSGEQQLSILIFKKKNI